MQHISTTMFLDHGWEPLPIGLGKILQIGVRKKNLQLWTVSSHKTVNKKYTWWHPSRGTGHILDHIVTPQAQRKYVDMVKTVHEGRRGNAGDPLGQTHRQKRAHPNSDYWDDYTDHLPVEIKIHHFPKWEKTKDGRKHPRKKTKCFITIVYGAHRVNN